MNEGKILLIVEDWETRRYLSAMLAFLGFRPVSAASLIEAVFHLTQESFAAVLVDQDRTPATVGDLRECDYKGPIILLAGQAEHEPEIMRDPVNGDVAMISRSVTPTLLRTALERLPAPHEAAS